MSTVDKLIYKIEQCIDYQNLYALEPEFNKHGLTVQTTSNSRVVLAKLRKGKAITTKVITDYIFIGSLENSTKELTDRAMMKICDFVRTNEGKSGKIKNIARVWRNGLRMYESSIVIVNEDVNEVVDNLIQE